MAPTWSRVRRRPRLLEEEEALSAVVSALERPPSQAQ